MSAAARVPERPSLDGMEAPWIDRWETDGIYRFDRTASREQVFAIDTPPPTVSGSIHMGTVFGYTQVDALARYQRMRGKAVFFPIGWDDNGLATERRVQNFYGVRCDPGQPFEPGFTPPYQGDVPKGHHEVPTSRPNFIDLCHELVQMDEAVFERIFRRLGLSYDWSLLYTTIGEVSRRVSQVAFLRNLARGEAYSAEAPTLWDVDDRTAVAQAEMEDRERPGAYHLIAFHGTGDVLVDTTRPELIVSCVALVAHPDDVRFQPLFGTTVRTPLFDVEVPVLAHPLAQPDKGTGIAMVCTFGDVTDVTWWRELDLPTRNVIGRDGRLHAITPDWLATDEARAAYAPLAGVTVKQAHTAMVEALRANGDLHGEPRPITHPVKFYERGQRPLEIVTSRQWYIRNGGRDPDLRAAFVARGGELEWLPEHMRHRYDHWVEGLNGDWLISRQRYFGVPIPLWYPLDAEGEPDHSAPIVPAEEALPIDPSTDVPPGYTAEQRGVPGGFAADPDVMDTWATSSLTPQIAGRWTEGDGLFARVFPMDLRPQGPEIIRTWLFSTVVRAHYEFDSLPWRAATINGWILDADRKKMSKSKGNVVTPAELIDKYGPDAMRYWALCARPGVDTAFDEGQLKIGRKLATKVLNVSKFVLGFEAPPEGALATEPLDAAMLARLDEVVAEATAAFDELDYARALERTEAFFWWFCDDYVELVKSRAYGTRGAEAAASAQAALHRALKTLQQLFAPLIPFVAEEMWSWWQQGSIHAQRWPTPVGQPGDTSGDTSIIEPLTEVLGRVRRAKTEAKVSQRAAIEHVQIGGPSTLVDALRLAEGDLRDAGSIAELSYIEAPELTCAVTLATTDAV